jgi:hypothetical protein
MKKLYKRIQKWAKSKIRTVTPGENAINGAALGVLILTGVLWLLFSLISIVNVRDPWLLLLFTGMTIVAIIAGMATPWILSKLNSIPKNIKISILVAFPLMFVIVGSDILSLMSFLLVGALIGAGFGVLKNTGFRRLTTPKKVVTLLGLTLGLAAFTTAVILYIPPGFEGDEFVNAASTSGKSIAHIEAETPATKGPYEILSLSYGSGKDKHRPEFGPDADILTDSVNGVAFIDSWDGFGGWWRTKYWGFDSKALPINARVWYPDGAGPFSLALIVHGNHSMQDYSDPGYEYLGNLLASRGIILASVDENFINGSWSDIFGGLDTENDARGWLLLEHLKVWHMWNADEESQFYGKVDTTSIALIGHSRGGEAIGHAAMLNALPYYPDDASIELGYNYNIKSVVAIAPVDGQYEPGDSRTKFENVSYFVLHGAQDADVSSFMGSQQFERVSFTVCLYHFKSGLYIYGANHGQFNTTWGNNDTGHPFTGFLNLNELMPAEEQRQIAEVYISAFLEATLRDKHEYLPLFADSRTGKEWLPETVFFNQFMDSDTHYFCTYDEDFDVVSTTQNGGKISAEKLTVWREQEIQLKWQKKGSRAVILGWNYEETLDDDTEEPNPEEEDENDQELSELVIPDSIVASYTVEFKDFLRDLDSSSVFVFSMAESTEDSNPKSSGKWVKDNNNEGKEEGEEGNNKKEKEEEQEDEEREEEEDENEIEEPLDFSIELTDSAGQVVKFALSNFSSLQREIDVQAWKLDFLTDDKESENIFQLFQYPVKTLQGINAKFDIARIKKCHFIFDKSEEGVVVIDNIGFMKDLRNK